MKKLFYFSIFLHTFIISTKVFQSYAQQATCNNAEFICFNTSEPKIDTKTTNSLPTADPADICGTAVVRATWFQIISNKKGGNIDFILTGVTNPLNVGFFSGDCGALVAEPACTTDATGDFTVTLNSLPSTTYYIVIDDRNNSQVTEFTTAIDGEAIRKITPSFTFTPVNQCFTDPESKVVFTNLTSKNDSDNAGTGLRIAFNFDLLGAPTQWSYLPSTQPATKKDTNGYDAPKRYIPVIKAINECTDTNGVRTILTPIIISDLKPSITLRPDNKQVCGFDTIYLKGTANMIPSPPGVPFPYDSARVTEWRWDFTNDGIYDDTIKLGDPDFLRDSSSVFYNYAGLIPPITVKLWVKGQCGPDSITMDIEADTFKVVAGIDQEICQGKDLLPVDTISVGSDAVRPLTFLWSVLPETNPGSISIDTNNVPKTTIKATSNASGVFYLKLLVTDNAVPGPCYNSDTVKITINPRPIIDFNANPKGLVCAFTPVPFNDGAGDSVEVTSGTPPYLYTWGDTIGLNSGRIQNPTATLCQTHTYDSLYVIDALGCDTVARNLRVYIYPAPSVTPFPTEQCITDVPAETVLFTVEWPSSVVPDDTPFEDHNLLFADTVKWFTSPADSNLILKTLGTINPAARDTLNATAMFHEVGIYNFEIITYNASTRCYDTLWAANSTTKPASSCNTFSPFNVYDSIADANITASKLVLCENDSTQLNLDVTILKTPPIQLKYVWFRRNVSTGGITAFSLSNPPFYVKRPTGEWDFWARVTNGDSDCSKNSDTVRISVNAAPIAVAVAIEDTLCSAQPVVLDGSGSTYNLTPGIADIKWTSFFGSPIVDDTLITTSATVSKSDSFRLVILYDITNGSCSDTATVNVNFHNKPAATFTLNKALVCPASPDTVALNGTGSNTDPRTTYLWTADNPGVTFDDVDTLITIARNVIGRTIFSLTVRDSTYTVNNGCDSTFTVSVDTLTRPSITVDIASLCLNPVTIDSVWLDVAGEGIPSSYLWSVNPLTTIHDHNKDNVKDTLSAHFTVGDTYTFTVVVTDSTNGCVSTLNYDYVVADSVENDLSPDTIICAGDSVQLSVTVSASNVKWTSVPPGPVDASLAVNGQDTTKTPLVKPVSGGVPTIYFYRVQSIAGTCADVDTIQVTVNPVKTSSFTVDAQICAGFSSTVTYTGNGDKLTDIYNWNFSGGTPIPTPPTPPAPGDSSAMEVTWPGPGIYDVELVVGTTLGCSSDTITQQVTVVTNPTSDFTLSNIACLSQLETDAATFTGFASGSATYSWNFGADAIPGSAVTAGPHDITWTTSGIKVVTLTVTEPGPPDCISSETQHSIDVRLGPTLDLGSDMTQCEGGTVTIYANQGYDVYAWAKDGIGIPGTADLLSFVFSQGVTNGLYSVTVTNADGCTNSDNVNISLGPFTPVITPSPGNTKCVGQPLQLNAGSGDSYLWSTGAVTQIIVTNNDVTTNYSVTVTNGGCTGTADIVLTINQNPDAGFSIDDNTLCMNQQTGNINTNSSDGSLVWDWDFGAGAAANPGVGPGPHAITYSAADAVTIQLTLTNLATGCLSQSNVVVTVNNLPKITAINNFPGAAKCMGDSTNLSTTPGAFSAYLWETFQNIELRTPTSATTWAIYNQSGDITVTVTDANGCTDDTTASVTVNPAPLDSSTTFCRGTTGTIGIRKNGLIITGTLWSGGPVVSPGLLTCTVNPTQTTIYKASVTYSPGCVSDISVTANVNQPDTYIDQKKVDVCDSLPPYKVSFDSSNFTSVSWTPATNLSCTNCYGPNITVPAPNNCSPKYQITVTDKTNGCTGVDTFEICRTNSISAQAGADTVRLCIVEGQPCMNYTLDGTASTAQTLKWYSTNPPINGVAATTLPVCLQVPDKNNPPVYEFELVGESPNCTNDTDKIVVTFYQYTRPNGGTDKTICGGDVQLTVLQGSEINSWYTTTAGAVVKNQSNPLNPLVTPSLSQITSLFVFQTTNGNGCIATDTVAVTIGGSLTPNLTVTPAITVCTGDSVHLTASGGTNYQFFEDNNSLGPSSQVNKYSFKASVTHAYKVTATAPGCTPVTTVPTTVTVKPLPVVSIIPAQACDGVPLQLVVDRNVSPAPENVLWSPVTGLSVDNPTSFNPIFTSPALGQTYNFKVIGTIIDVVTCSDSDEVQNITVNQLSSTDAGQNDTICANETAQIGPAGNPGASYSYSWEPQGQVSNPAIYNPVTAQLSSSTTFVLFMTDLGWGCSKSDTMEVIVGAEPVYSIPPDTIFACIEDTVTISGVTSDPDNKFSWTATGYEINNPNSLTPSVITRTQVDTIPMVFNVTSPGGCTRNDTIFIGLYNDALANFGSEMVCARDTIHFTDSSARAYKWYWDFGDASVTNDTSTKQNPEYVYKDGGDYSVNLTINIGSKNCESTVKKVINVFGTPNAKFTIDVPDKYTFPLYTFTNQTNGLDNSMKVEWNFDDGTTLTDNGKTVTHRFTFADEDSFKVKMTVTNKDGCIDSFSLKRDIGMDAPKDPPNVFTPNGDNFNDAFVIRGMEVFLNSNLVVFNRWGTEVYRKKNYQNDWKAEGVSDGVYFWIMEYNYKTRGTLKGWLTVIR